MNTPTGPITTVTARALIIWGVALGAYVTAVFARTSLSATGVEAAWRFDASPAILSLFTVLQLAVYAGMQIPAGATLDRIGPRRAITVGLVLITTGLVSIALVTNVPAAIGSRVLIGTGDAFVFISVLRLLPAWFPAKYVPLTNQISGMTGQLGQIMSLGPLVGLILWQGWTAAFVAAGALTLLFAAMSALVIRDGVEHISVPLPDHPHRDVVARARLPIKDGAGSLLSTWRNPGTRAGFWIHFTAPFSAYTFTLLWGFAFMTKAEGFSEDTALGVLSVYVIGCLVFGTLVGVFTSRYPARRTTLVVVMVCIQIAVWAIVLAWPGPIPHLWVYALAAVLSSGGPCSLVGFDLSRTTNPLSKLGLATAMVNTGGFISTLVMIFIVGLILEILGQSTPEQFTDTGFTIAWLAQIPMWILGLAMMRRSTRRFRSAVAAG